MGEDAIKRDLVEVGIKADDVLDRMRRRRVIKTADLATAQD